MAMNCITNYSAPKVMNYITNYFSLKVMSLHYKLLFLMNEAINTKAKKKEKLKKFCGKK